jgi:hypothetical protein
MRRRSATGVLLLGLGVACSGTPATKQVAAPRRPVAPIVEPAVEREPALAAEPRLRRISESTTTFAARVSTLNDDIRARMGTSWRPGCPVALEDLRVITMTFWDFENAVSMGELMVHRRYAQDVIGVFRTLFDARFPIERMELANGYMGNDPPLALRNNTAGFNCRRSVGSGAWSEHAYGRAVDINPDQNPYVSPGGRVEPPFGARWVDRSLNDPGMIRPGDVVVKAFRAIGWRWGGSYRRNRDWMHFSRTGR